MIALPFLAALADASSLIVSKFFLRRFGKLSFREFNWLVFLGIVTVLVLVCIGFHQFPHRNDVIANWPTILALGGLGALGNMLFFRGLEEERVSNVEPLVVFNPLAGILMASVFYPSERSWLVYGAVALAVAILAWANVQRGKLQLNRALLSIMGFWVIYGLEVSLVRHLLETFSPVSLYLLRGILVFIALTIMSTPRFKFIRSQHVPLAMLLGLLAVISVVSTYTAIHYLGVASALFAMVLSPVLVYWFSGSVLHDRWNRKNVIAGILIVLLVVGVTFLLNR